MNLDKYQAEEICRRLLPFRIYSKMSDVELIILAKNVLLFSAEKVIKVLDGYKGK
jgi:hypothetical protein